MADKIACPKCGEENFSTDRQCLSCGASLAPTAPPGASSAPATPVRAPSAAALPKRMLAGDDRSWWRRCTDDVVEYQTGGLIGMVAIILLLAGPWLLSSQGAIVFVAMMLTYGIAAFCFVWYVRDPDSWWPLVVCIIFSNLIGWLFIALGAFAGAAIEKRIAQR